MTHVLLITSAMAGRVNVTCALARRLEATGHRVTISGSEGIAARVAANGSTMVRLGPPMPPMPDAPTVPHGGIVGRILALVRRVFDLPGRRRRTACEVDRLAPTELRERIAELGPDLCVVDMELPVEVMAAVASGTPVVTFTTMLSLWKRPGLPPLHAPIVPGEGWRGTRLGIEFAWVAFRTARMAHRFRVRVTRAGADRPTVLRRVAAELGLRRHGLDASQWLIPFVFSTLPSLSFNAAELEFPHEPGANPRYVGPLVDPDLAAPVDDAVRTLLNDIDGRRASGACRALVYAGFGAWHKGDDGGFVRRVVAAFALLPDCELVVGLGGRIDPASVGPTTPNVHLLEWAPQAEVLRHADAAIHHAGISSVNECVLAGVPMLLYPFDFLDQPGNAARAAFHGIGAVGDRVTDPPDLIARRLDGILSDPGFATRVAAMRTSFDRYGDAAVTAIDELTPRKPPVG